LPECFKRSLSFRISGYNFVYRLITRLSHACYLFSLSHSPSFDEEYKSWNSSVYNFLQLPILLSKHPQSMIFPYKPRRKIIYLYILIFTFLDKIRL
jgi:hypothetical protein